MKVSSRVDSLLGSMSLEEKVGQIFIFTFVSLKQAELDMKYHPGGYVRIYSDALTVARESRALQARAKLPLIISADFERGIGSTIYGAIDLAGNMCIGAAGNEDLAFATGRAIAEEARAMGVNMNYVPVVDVNVNENNPIINIRAFGGDAADVARIGVALIKGTQAGGVLACAKHFPGHGDTHVDSHTEGGVIDVNRQRLEEVELLPFRAAIAGGVDSIMSAHLQIPAIDPEPLPATLSYKVMTGLLRDEMGFQGVAVSDALEMGAVTRNFPPEIAIVKALNAGCDQLIMPRDNRRAVEILADAVRRGEVPESRLDEAVARILTMKENRGLFEDKADDLTNLASRLNTAEHFEVALNTALAGVTLVRNESNVLPLAGNAKAAVVAFSNYQDARSYYAEAKTIGAHLSDFVDVTRFVDCGRLDEHAVHEFGARESAMEAASRSDLVVIAAFNKVMIAKGTAALEDRFVKFVKEIQAVGKPVVLISFGSPYIIKQMPDVNAFVCAYGGSEATQQATARLIAGKAPFRGKLPVSVTLS
ncbi:MAG: glycoside hydrolase family 3 protein [Candidatus Sumerlaeaceae bacterium]|nr:glycoside hydrolase family 3 protein [Candidatus Sumerlaeaceae bacterium]